MEGELSLMMQQNHSLAAELRETRADLEFLQASGQSEIRSKVEAQVSAALASPDVAGLKDELEVRTKQYMDANKLVVDLQQDKDKLVARVAELEASEYEAVRATTEASTI